MNALRSQLEAGLARHNAKPHIPWTKIGENAETETMLHPSGHLVGVFRKFKPGDKILILHRKK